MKNAVNFLLRWLFIFLTGSVIAFLIVRAMPVSPVDYMLEAHKLPRTEENIAFFAHKLGLDGPLWFQYVIWMKDFLQGDWGVTLSTGLDIKAQFLRKMPWSFCIDGVGIILSSILSFFCGYRAALRPRGICDRISSALAVLSQSVPNFITTIVIIYFFGVKFRLVRFFTGNGIFSLLMAIALTTLYSAGGLTRIVRRAFREEMDKSYVRFAVSRGFSKEEVLFHHASRPVICRLISAVSSNFAFLFGGSTVLEFAFAIPGVSYFLVDSMNSRDYTVMQSYILVVILWMFFVHLILNLLLQLIDVRRR